MTPCTNVTKTQKQRKFCFINSFKEILLNDLSPIATHMTHVARGRPMGFINDPMWRTTLSFRYRYYNWVACLIPLAAITSQTSIAVILSVSPDCF